MLCSHRELHLLSQHVWVGAITFLLPQDRGVFLLTEQVSSKAFIYTKSAWHGRDFENSALGRKRESVVVRRNWVCRKPFTGAARQSPLVDGPRGQWLCVSWGGRKSFSVPVTLGIALLGMI